MADIPLTEYIKLNKPPKGYPDWGSLYNANFDLTDGKFKDINARLGQKVTSTTQNITYHIRPDGNDNNIGLTNTANGALKSIQAAINRLPQCISHEIHIRISDGTYSESVNIDGFFGGGSLTIIGTPSVNIDRFSVSNCKARIYFRGGMNLTTTTNIAMDINYCGLVDFRVGAITRTSTSNGVRAANSNCWFEDIEISNRSIGVFSLDNSTVMVYRLRGTDNTVGVQAQHGATIGIYGTYPTGTTNESVSSGGEIRYSE